MKRIIDFQVEHNTEFMLIFGYPVTDSEVIRVEFDWDEKEDVMRVAERALEKKMDYDYVIDYWEWIL